MKNELSRFSKKTIDKLGHYVYCLRDPQTKKIFYVGKAKSDRALSHLKVGDNPSSEKERIIVDLRKRGLEPQVDILRFGLESEFLAYEVEAAIIDAIGLENLTNEVRGKGTERGLVKASVIDRIYSAAEVDLNGVQESLMLFFLKDVSPTLSKFELYDRVRGFWYEVAVAKRTPALNGELPYQIALALSDGVVIQAYSILSWFRAGQTLSTRSPKLNGEGFERGQRYEFVGNEIDHPLIGRKLRKDGMDLVANQKGYSYHN